MALQPAVREAAVRPGIAARQPATGNRSFPGTQPNHQAAQQGGRVRLNPAQLGRLVCETTTRADGWRSIVRFENRRWFRRLALTDSYEIWLLSWLPGQGTGFHDHGDACGAFTVAAGELLETLAVAGSRSLRVRTAGQGSVTTFGGQHLHAVSNASSETAISVHAYSPPLSAMRRYEMTATGLALVRTDRAELDW